MRLHDRQRGPVLHFIVAVAAIVLSPSPADAKPEHSVVATDRGPVRGVATPAMVAFIGIPYAAPPVGDLRWRAPQLHAGWHGPLDATAFGSSCPQTASPIPGGVVSASEDCLFLNVYAPIKAKGNKFPNGPHHRVPVMVWIHGGGLTSGASNPYDPGKLVQQGNVIVVTINYRLGVLGFLAHSDLTAESPDQTSSNYGLMDQQFALGWVRRNIARFGGDPDNVTIFGESGGGVSVHANLASPTAAGLFHRAIVQSGAYSLTQPALAAVETLGAAFANLAGCSSQTAACLRTLPVAAILSLQDVVFSNGVVPIVDGKVLTQPVAAAFASGQFNRVPVIEGSNRDEYRLFVGITELLTGTPLTAAGYIPAIQAATGVSAAGATFLATSVYPLAAYPPPATAPSIALGALGTDAGFACNARLVSQLLAQYVPTYQYEFNDPTAPLPIGFSVSFPSGAYHASELQYLFGLAALGFPGLDPDQQQLSDAMVRYWTRFARTGQPTAPGAGAWPQYGSSDLFQSLEAPTPTMKSGFSVDHKCAVWGTP